MDYPTGNFSMFPHQYKEIVGTIEKIDKANVLVFGCGSDSPLYRTATLGRVVFIEDHPYFFENCPYEKYLVSYTTSVGVWWPEDTPTDFPKELLEVTWDVIIVDGPTGYAWDCPGRQLSIYTASLFQETAIVYVHDYNREWEKACCMKYFMKGPHLYGVGDRTLAKFGGK